jgi:hypothetical protein
MYPGLHSVKTLVQVLTAIAFKTLQSKMKLILAVLGQARKSQITHQAIRTIHIPPPISMCNTFKGL